MRSTDLPWCQLHQRPVVNEAPPLCPFRHPDPYGTLRARQDRAYFLIASGDSSAGLAALRTFQICTECEAMTRGWGRRLAARSRTAGAA